MDLLEQHHHEPELPLEQIQTLEQQTDSGSDMNDLPPLLNSSSSSSSASTSPLGLGLIKDLNLVDRDSSDHKLSLINKAIEILQMDIDKATNITANPNALKRYSTRLGMIEMISQLDAEIQIERQVAGSLGEPSDAASKEMGDLLICRIQVRVALEKLWTLEKTKQWYDGLAQGSTADNKEEQLTALHTAVDEVNSAMAEFKRVLSHEVVGQQNPIAESSVRKIKRTSRSNSTDAEAGSKLHGLSMKYAAQQHNAASSLGEPSDAADKEEQPTVPHAVDEAEHEAGPSPGPFKTRKVERGV